MTITNRVSSKSVMAGATPIADVVDAPTIGTATAGTETATVAYTAVATGGAATSFTAISTPGSITGTGSSPITVSGLTGGTAYTFKVYGTNASGVWSGVQSQASNSVTPTSITGAYDSIATATGTGSSAVISFTSIPSTYSHLQLRISGGNSGYACTMTFNSDTGTNYANHRLTGTGSSVIVGAQTNRNGITFAGYSGLVYASVVSATIMDILDYANTNKYKTSRDLTGYDTNSAGYIDFESGLWMSTSAINRIDLTMNTGNWASGSQVALYGIKGN